MIVKENQKIEVLLSLLNERYEASHRMRTRSTQFSVWLLGFVLVANGWLIINGYKLSYQENILITILVSILGMIAIFFIRGIHKGFNNNRDILIKLERAIGCYEVGAYIENGNLYPPQYENNRFSLFGHFETLYMLLGSTYIITILIIWI